VILKPSRMGAILSVARLSSLVCGMSYNILWSSTDADPREFLLTSATSSPVRAVIYKWIRRFHAPAGCCECCYCNSGNQSSDCSLAHSRRVVLHTPGGAVLANPRQGAFDVSFLHKRVKDSFVPADPHVVL
jgi:hypothetical protein